MEVDHKLKQILLGKLLSYYPTMFVYPIKELSNSEKDERAKYYASQFMGGKSIQPFRSHREDHSILISLPSGVTMQIFDNSFVVSIEREMKSFENTIKKNSDLDELIAIFVNTMKKLQFDKYKLPIEHAELERLWEFKKTGITKEGKTLPVILCRIAGGFRRYINDIPVYGDASIYIKIADQNIAESINIEWRPIEEKPKTEARVIRPEEAATRILNELGKALTDKISTENFQPEYFDLGYYSKPKRLKQNYMQPVYIAALKSLRTRWITVIVTPATIPVYEHFDNEIKSADPKKT